MSPVRRNTRVERRREHFPFDEENSKLENEDELSRILVAECIYSLYILACNYTNIRRTGGSRTILYDQNLYEKSIAKLARVSCPMSIHLHPQQ